MTILSFPPGLTPGGSEWTLEHNTQTFTSPLSRAEQHREFPGARWLAVLTFPTLIATERAVLEAFLARLRGAAGRFYLHDHARPDPAGKAIGAPAVAGAGQTGAALITVGWSPSVTGILKTGDRFAVGTELKTVVEDAHSDGAGMTTLIFEPPLRHSPADGAPLITAQPTAVFRLKDDDQARFRNRPAGLSSITIECVEAF